MQTTWKDDSASEFAVKTFLGSVVGETSTAAAIINGSGIIMGDDDVTRRLAADDDSADGISVSTPITAIMVVSAFVFLTVFSVIAYVMRVRYRHQRSSWHHVEEEGIQLQPFIRNA